MRLKMNFIFVIAILLCAGCASTKYGGSAVKTEDDIIVTAKNLADHIDTIPRLTVKGNQVYNTVSSSTSTKPLLVLDGVQVGRDLKQVLSLIDEHQGLQVEFIDMSEATIKYGENGRNGAIIIKRG